MSRLEAAIDSGLEIPAGRVLVLRSPVGLDLTPLGAAEPMDTHVVQGFKPAYDHFHTLGFNAHPNLGSVCLDSPFALALVCATRSKQETRALIATAASRAPLVLVDGQKTDGIESLLREVKRRAEVTHVTAKAHGKLFAFASEGADFSDWPMTARQVDGFETRPGMFSDGKVDAGSALLAAALPRKLPGRVVDLGAGWGYLSRAILSREGVSELHLVEAEHSALDCARRNIDDPRARFHWTDARTFVLPQPMDAVVTNPPFHQGRSAETQLGQAFFATAARLLAPKGRLFCVANRHLPYEETARALFARVEEIGGDPRFKILLAENPRRVRR